MTAVDYIIEQLQSPCKGIPSNIIETAKELEEKQKGYSEDEIEKVLNFYSNDVPIEYIKRDFIKSIRKLKYQ